MVARSKKLELSVACKLGKKKVKCSDLYLLILNPLDLDHNYILNCIIFLIICIFSDIADQNALLALMLM